MTSIIWQGGLTGKSLGAATEATAEAGSATELLARAQGLDAASQRGLVASVAAESDASLTASLTEALRRLAASLAATLSASFSGSSSDSSPASASSDSGTGDTTSAGSTTALDLSAPANLAPGAYTLDEASGQGVGGQRPEISVNSGDTWGEVLARLSRTFGASGAAALSRLVPVTHSLVATPPRQAEASQRERTQADGQTLGQTADAADALTRGLSEVLAAHNEVSSLLAANAGRVSAEALRGWSAATSGRASALADIGVERSAAGLRLSEAGLRAALEARPEAVRAALAGDGGLLPALNERVAAALSTGAADWLASAQGGQSAAGLLLGGAEAETDAAAAAKSGGLVNLYDGNFAAGPELSGLGGLVRQKG